MGRPIGVIVTRTSTFETSIMLARLCGCLAPALGALALGMGCSKPSEGDRCNPLRSSDECGSGLVCSGFPLGLAAAHPIEFCPDNYCCPANVTPSNSPYCQPGCNGGAAAICAAEGGASVCAFAACVANAADASTCVADDDGGALDGTGISRTD
jgi:hypothetical protein